MPNVGMTALSGEVRWFAEVLQSALRDPDWPLKVRAEVGELLAEVDEYGDLDPASVASVAMAVAGLIIKSSEREEERMTQPNETWTERIQREAKDPRSVYQKYLDRQPEPPASGCPRCGAERPAHQRVTGDGDSVEVCNGCFGNDPDLRPAVPKADPEYANPDFRPGETPWDRPCGDIDSPDFRPGPRWVWVSNDSAEALMPRAENMQREEPPPPEQQGWRRMDALVQQEILGEVMEGVDGRLQKGAKEYGSDVAGYQADPEEELAAELMDAPVHLHMFRRKLAAERAQAAAMRDALSRIHLKVRWAREDGVLETLIDAEKLLAAIGDVADAALLGTPEPPLPAIDDRVLARLWWAFGQTPVDDFASMGMITHEHAIELKSFFAGEKRGLPYGAYEGMELFYQWLTAPWPHAHSDRHVHDLRQAWAQFVAQEGSDGQP